MERNSFAFLASFLFFVLLFPAFAFSDSPTITSSNHPQGSWSSATYINFDVSYPDAIGYSYILDSESDTIPPKTINSEGSELNLGGKLDGIYWFHVRAKTVSGWSDTTHYELKHDTTGPSRPEGVNVVSNEDGSVTISWLASEDELSGVSHYNVYRSTLRFINDNGISREFTLRDAVVVQVGEGIVGTSFTDTNFIVGSAYMFHYKIEAVDNAGNISPPSSASSARTVSFCDFTDSLDLSVELEDSNLSIDIASDVSFKKGHLVVIDPTGVETIVVDSTPLVSELHGEYSLSKKPNGDYNVFFSSIDDDYDDCTAGTIFVYDTVSPTVEFVSPNSSKELSGSVEFTFLASDPGTNASGIDKVSLFLEDNGSETFLKDANLSAGKYVLDWNTMAYEEGRFKLIVRATDRGGNTAEDSRLFNVKNSIFAITRAQQAINDANTESTKAREYIDSLQEQNIDVSSLRSDLPSADENLTVAIDFFEQGFHEEQAENYANAAKEIYSSIVGRISISDYGADQAYSYNESQLDVFLSAIGLTGQVAEKAKSQISSTSPTRALHISEVSEDGNTYYVADIKVSVSNADKNFLSLNVVEVVPKRFTDSADNLSSSSEYSVIQSDPVLLFGPFDLNFGKTETFVYSLNQKLTKEQADTLLSAGVMSFYVSPPVVFDSSVDKSEYVGALSSASGGGFELPNLELGDNSLLIIGIAGFLGLGILFVIFVLIVVGIYFFFIRKKKDKGGLRGP